MKRSAIACLVRSASISFRMVACHRAEEIADPQRGEERPPGLAGGEPEDRLRRDRD
jgi:hypothetical protein